MADTILTVYADHNGDFKKMFGKEQRTATTYAKYDIVYRHLAAFIQLRYYSFLKIVFFNICCHYE